MNPRAILSAFVCSLFLAASASLCAAQTSYAITDLGTLTSNGYSVARAVNATAEVTGAAGNSNSNLSDIFFYSNGAMTSLGTLGGTSGIGNGINASGQVAGYSQNSSQTYRAFLSSGSTLTDIGDLGGGSAVAYAINDSGQVVGSAVTAKGENHPFLYRNGRMIDLGTLGSSNNDWWNSAQGINNSGVVTGTSYDAQGNFFGFVWKSGKMTKMGTLGGPWSQGVCHQQQRPGHRPGLYEEWLGSRVHRELWNLPVERSGHIHRQHQHRLGLRDQRLGSRGRPVHVCRDVSCLRLQRREDQRSQRDDPCRIRLGSDRCRRHQRGRPDRRHGHAQRAGTRVSVDASVSAVTQKRIGSDSFKKATSFRWPLFSRVRKPTVSPPNSSLPSGTRPGSVPSLPGCRR